MKPDPESPLPIRPVKNGSSRSPFVAAVTAAVFVFLVCCCVLVIFILPARTGSNQVEASMNDGPDSMQGVGGPAITDASLKPETDKARQHALGIQARLESEGVKVWGLETLQTDYPEAEAALSKAESAYARGSFGEALSAYNTAVELLETLDASRPERIDNAITSGESALQDQDEMEARRYFEVVLSLDPGNARALAGMKYAGIQPEIRQLARQAQSAESSGDLTGALKRYQDILELDGNHEESRAHVDRLEQAIDEDSYQAAISRVVQALQDGDLETAQPALEAARIIKPEDPLLNELEAEFKEQRLLKDINGLRQQALNAENSGAWQEAADAYASILALDRTIAFAQAGKVQADTFATYRTELQRYLSGEDLLLSTGNVTHARQLGNRVLDVRPPGSPLHSMASELIEILKDYEMPATVRITSDGATNVRIYRVGSLGTFTFLEKELLPGRYEIHGSRSGYRDVSFLFTVPPGGSDYAITISCTEKI